ncbi:hypothetical protein CP_0778 [Chlamydia pneumoniae AR39]|uniref:Uncharacterized protein n=1 Tax=Chlamydia pneumoniae TaxID=83558 RepID=Q9K1Y7_CHLPN|nr:hypothetical protein CP_0778 [Chlamydia pneumoniae AR39]
MHYFMGLTLFRLKMVRKSIKSFFLKSTEFKKLLDNDVES